MAEVQKKLTPTGVQPDAGRKPDAFLGRGLTEGQGNRTAARVLFPPSFQRVTKEDKTSLDFEGKIGDLLNILAEKYGEGFKKSIFGEGKTLARYVNLYINGEDVRFLSGLESEVKAGDEISIVPAVAGG